ncbi:hypothetical protein [Winogradskyella tangerina]|uniref:hypothetical protein n=1 Tax=Winogradskyella tangerina TaxID=2023240 RepID=UPI000DBE0E7E|nr:hypothetical protein [Winogradskyella tangerina]
MKQDVYTKAIQLALRVGRNDNEISQKIVDLNQFCGDEPLVFNLKVKTKSHAFFMLDVTLCDDNKWRLIEANGSNAALSSTAHLGDEKRAQHLVDVFNTKDNSEKCAVIFTHQFRFIHLGEFFCRAAKFTDYLSQDKDAILRSCDEKIGNEQVTVVAGEIKEVAAHITCNGHQLLYKGITVRLISNPNLLPELKRMGVAHELLETIGKEIVHEQSCVALIHDKSLQQTMCLGTGIAPLKCVEAKSREECVDILSKARVMEQVLVGKMNAGSGGTGIEFFTPQMSDENINETLDQLENAVIRKYGPESVHTMFPIRFFEFAKAKGLNIEGKKHLWDLRMMVIVRPGEVDVSPCVVRACPKPFDGSYSKGRVINNLSGRVDPDNLAKYMLQNPFLKCSNFSDGLVIPESKLNELVISIVKWSENAVNFYCK